MNAERMNWEAKWPNPYVGPRPYRREEQDKMGGREKETGRLLNLLIADLSAVKVKRLQVCKTV